MPRLIDRIDAAAGFVPTFLDHDVDYLTCRPSPARLINDQGHYVPGWYERFDGELNLDDSMALDLALQRWLHITLDTPDHFVVMNLADMGKASNTAVLVVDKASGDFHEASITGLGPRGTVDVSDDVRAFRDPQHGSMARFDDGDQRLTFSMHAEQLHVAGLAHTTIGPPLVQVTRFHRGRGSLQWYGNLELDAGMLTLGDRVIPLPPGTLGTFDRTVGHQRGIQAWNWIALAGSARCTQSGRVVPIGVQIAKDRDGARPRVEAKKYAVWIEGQLHKVPTARFDYDVLDPQARTTSPWRITSPPPEVPAATEGEGAAEGGGATEATEATEADHGWVDLTFTPLYHRRENKRLLIARTDFNQYYGLAEGHVRVGGRTWELLRTFAVTEESWLEL